jgi:GT2 family glycosyltransferase
MRLEVEDYAEILVVDSCPSTDDASRVAEEFARVRYVREPVLGLNIARNRALAEATQPIVAFTDDDAAPERHWLQALSACFDDPQVACATGLTLPIELETRAQQWFERRSSLSRGFERLVFERETFDPFRAGRVGVGANMAIRRSVIDRIGWFDHSLDVGTPARSGGDYDLFWRVLAAGYRIVYEPSALVWHRHRRTWSELRWAIFGYGVGLFAAWTRALLVSRDPAVFKIAAGWLRYRQYPALLDSLRNRPDSVPLDLLLVELCGCVVGPFAYALAYCRRRIAHRL